MYYGRQTQLGIENFGNGASVGELKPLVANYARIKSAAAKANAELGVITAEVAQAIEKAAEEIILGKHPDQFPTLLVIGGGGTTTNMNFNEVIAARATEILGSKVHPNDHVNASQSTNDTYPSAMALTIYELSQKPISAVKQLIREFELKKQEYKDVVRLGRTCLQDAVTLTVEQTHRSHISALTRVVSELEASVKELTSVSLGATVLGTGIGAPKGYQEKAIFYLSKLCGYNVYSVQDLVDALSHLDTYSRIAAASSRVAMTMSKIAADFRLLSSGPKGGYADLTLPAVQAGSSIMPGKINPVIPEYVMQLGFRIRGNAHTVDLAVAAGELELNIMEPVIVDSLANIFVDLDNAAQTFAEKCVKGIIWAGRRQAENVEAGFDRWIELAAEKGYDIAAAEVRKSLGE